jgi:hypothetical protein
MGYGGGAPGGGDLCDTEVQTCVDTTDPNNQTLGYSANSKYKASKFAASGTKTICALSLKVFKTGNPTFDVNVYIYTDNAGEPGVLVGTGSVAVSAGSLPTSADYYLWTGLSADLTDTVEYWIVAVASVVGDASNYVTIRASSPCDLEEGTKYSPDGTTWTTSNSARGFNFKTYE